MSTGHTFGPVIYYFDDLALSEMIEAFVSSLLKTGSGNTDSRWVRKKSCIL